MLTIAELLAGKKPDVPPMRRTFERAQRLTSSTHRQAALIGASDPE
jgi:hypothetical protein